MPDLATDITVASTTDTQADVEKAAGLEPQKEPEKKPEAKDPEPNKEEPIAGKGKPEEKPIAHKKNDPQKRIDKLTGRNYQLEREKGDLQARADKLERELEEARSGRKVEAKAEEPKPAAQRSKPKEDELDAKGNKKYATYDDYIEDLADWKAEQRAAAIVNERLEAERKNAEKEIEREDKEAEAARTKEIFDAHNKRVSEARGKYEDFDEVVGQDIQVPAVTQIAIFESENGPDIMYYLGQNPEACQKLMELQAKKGDAAVLQEIGKISARLEAQDSKPDLKATAEKTPAEKEKPKPVSKAPEPIKPVGSSASHKSAMSMDELPYEDYRRIRESQLADGRR